MHSHGHSHGHGSGHDHDGGWEAWSGQRTLRVTGAFVALFAVATVVAMVMLWPTGAGRDNAISQADEIGLATERLSATVHEVRDGQCSYSTAENPQDCRELSFVLHEGPAVDAIIVLPEINLTFGQITVDLQVGDEVMLGFEDSTNTYFYADRDRRTSLVWLTGLFAVVVIALGRFRGALALLAMASTIVVLVAFVAPSVLDGNDPLVVSVVAASAIAFISLYLTHGFSPTTTVALAGTLGALGLTLGLSWVFFELANFSGLATEAGLTLPFIAEDINLASLLLGGAVLGALGALDDVTVTQVATVSELRYRNPDLTTTELVVSGVRVGREHIASTVNTLLLAYAGASMPILLLIAASDQSLAMAANSELVAVEIVRTLCGSIGLVAAVPITTALAAIVTTRDVAGGVNATETSPARPEAGTPLVPGEASPDAVTDDAGPDGQDLHGDSSQSEPEIAIPPVWDDFAPPDDPTDW